MNKIKERLSNFELLRIISMIMIIMHHYSVHGNWVNKLSEVSLNNIIIDFLAIGGKIGVVCFVLIAGYFGIESKFSVKKIIKLILEVLFYTTSFCILFNIVRFAEIDIGLKVILKSIFPITFSMYWFITVYVIIYILSPYINKFIHSITKQEFKTLLVVLLVLCSVIPTFTTSNLNIGEITYYIFIYMVGAYIKLYLESVDYKKISIWGIIISYLLIFLSQIVFEYLGTLYAFFGTKIDYFAKQNSILVLVAAISLFMICKEAKIKSKVINIIASTSFGVYLIHDNYFVRIYFWQILFKNNNYYDNELLWLHALISIIMVYIICIVIDLFRIYVVEKSLLGSIYNLYDKFKNKFLLIVSRKRG